MSWLDNDASQFGSLSVPAVPLFGSAREGAAQPHLGVTAGTCESRIVSQGGVEGDARDCRRMRKRDTCIDDGPVIVAVCDCCCTSARFGWGGALLLLSSNPHANYMRTEKQ